MYVRTIVSCRSYLIKCPAKRRMNGNEQTATPREWRKGLSRELCSIVNGNVKVNVTVRDSRRYNAGVKLKFCR